MEAKEWNAAIAQLPNPHLLQTYQWAQVKAQVGWQPYYKVWHDEHENVRAAALMLQRSIHIPLIDRYICMFYAPKGPLLADWSDAALRRRVFDDMRAMAAEHGAFLLKIDPDVSLGTGVPGEDGEAHPLGEQILQEMKAAGWQFSGEQVQYRNTVLVDLTALEEELLARMKQKTRYNVRLAGRRGVAVRQGGEADFELLYKMYAETSARDGFAIRDWDYYQGVWQTFYHADMLTPLIAEVEGHPVGGLMLFHFGARAWYLHGMSRDAHREKMPNYLLQWEAMRAAKALGCTTYDMWGAPDEFHRNDPMWGVYRFKDGFGGQVARRIGAWDLPLQPLVYRLYTGVLPRLLGLMRLGARAKQTIRGDL